MSMHKDQYGQLIFNERDICDLIMKGEKIDDYSGVIVDETIDDNTINSLNLTPYKKLDISVEEFDSACQSNWHMPEEYKNLDIAEYVLSLCTSQAELQRCGHELLIFQKKGLFNLLRYLKYLVDTMKENQIIWGVGRGSSVASYVLYKLKVHSIDSMYYDLKVEEFLR